LREVLSGVVCVLCLATSAAAQTGPPVFYFAGSDLSTGQELWKTSGYCGSRMVRDIYSGQGSSSPGNLTVVGGTVFFDADDGVNGRELWKSDGTPAGTVMVKDVTAGPGSSRLSKFTNVNGLLFFIVELRTLNYPEEHHTQLWRSDGTASGTILLGDFWNCLGCLELITEVSHLVSSQGRLYFVAPGYRPPVYGLPGLYRSDGTVAGTVQVKEFSRILDGTTSLESLTDVNGTLFFVRNGEVWKSDGTNAGTVLVKTIDSGYANSVDPALTGLTNVNGTLFLAADDGVNGRELWKTGSRSWERRARPSP